jgi:iron complex transport system substrate-binding protein
VARTPHRSSLRSLLPVVIVALLVACGGPVSTTFTQTGQAVPEPPTPAPTFPLSLTDDAGRTVAISAAPQRIVSLAPSNTEIVCALDACDRLVGVPEFRDGYPAAVLDAIAEVPSVVSFGPVDREAIVAADPDLILAAGNELTSSDDIAALADLGYPVLTLYPESVDEVFADIELVGVAIGESEEAGLLVAAARERVDAVVETVAAKPAPRTFYEVSVFEGQIYTAGEDSFLASLITLAGGDPVEGDALSTAIDLEMLVAADPQLILLGDAAYDPTITPETVAARPGWDAMTAVTQGDVRPVTDDIVITRPGPRIVDGLESLARLIHPDLYE